MPATTGVYPELAETGSHTLGACSTIGPAGLNFRVRDGRSRFISEFPRYPNSGEEAPDLGRELDRVAQGQLRL